METIEKRLGAWRDCFNLEEVGLLSFKIPCSVAKRAEKMMRDFVWEGYGEASNYLVGFSSWSRGKEGIGVGYVEKRNKDLLAK